MGNTGLKVSRIGFGNWLNCEGEKAEETISAFIKRAYDLGINFFDTAEVIRPFIK